MSRSVVAALALALGLVHPWAGAGDPEAEILRADAALQQALQRRDRPALERLVAAGFTWVHASDGRSDDRESWLASAQRGLALTGQRLKRTEHGASIALFPAGRPMMAVRVLRVRLLDEGRRESWLRQTQTWVRDGEAWKLAAGQGSLMYEGAPLDATLHARYAGRYEIAPGRGLVLDWDGEALLATWPGGQRGQVFLASPTEEATRTVGSGRLRFELDAAGAPVAASLVRGDEVLWRAPRL